MVNLPPSLLVLLSSALLVAASVVPVAEVKKEAYRPTPVDREPEYPLYLAKREGTGRKTRHLRPVYENTKREITPPDVGQVASFPPTGIPQPIRGPYGDIRSGGTNEEIDRQNPDYVTPPLTDNGLFTSRSFFVSELSPAFLGNIPNLKWSFSLSHSRLLKGGWIREQTVTDLPPCEFPLVRLLMWLSDLNPQQRSSRLPNFALPRTVTVNCKTGTSTPVITSF